MSQTFLSAAHFWTWGQASCKYAHSSRWSPSTSEQSGPVCTWLVQKVPFALCALEPHDDSQQQARLTNPRPIPVKHISWSNQHWSPASNTKAFSDSRLKPWMTIQTRVCESVSVQRRGGIIDIDPTSLERWLLWRRALPTRLKAQGNTQE